MGVGADVTDAAHRAPRHVIRPSSGRGRHIIVRSSVSSDAARREPDALVRDFLPLALVLAASVLAVLQVGGGLRVAAVLAVAAVVPGSALTSFLSVSDRWASAALVVTMSLAVHVIVGTGLLALGVWTPGRAALVALLPAVIVHLRRLQFAIDGLRTPVAHVRSEILRDP